MSGIAVEGMPVKESQAQPDASLSGMSPEEIQREKNKEYQRASRERKKLRQIEQIGLTGGVKGPSPAQATPVRPVLRAVQPGERAVKPGDKPVPLSEGLRIEAIAPSLAMMAAQMMNDGRLAILATVEVPIDGPDTPPRPLMAAFGASLDKVADLSGITLTALEAAYLNTAMLAMTMVGIYRSLEPRALNPEKTTVPPPKKD